MTPHNEANLGDIAEIVLMPGDPLRAKYIADNFFDDAKQINSVRNMFGYTGTYKGKRLSVFASGMGMPSMGIYSYELFKFYNVQKVIRIGSCGSYIDKLNLFDTILIDNCYTESNYAYELTGEKCNLINSNDELNNVIEQTANEINVPISRVDTLCTDCFDGYITDLQKLFDRFPKDINLSASEMEAFALFYNAKLFNRQASCLLTVVDSNVKHEKMSPKDRETSLNNMIKLALESAIKL